MDEIEYFDMMENAAIGQAMADCMREIFDRHGVDSLGALSRSCYKYTDAGISVGFGLHDDSYAYAGDARLYKLGAGDCRSIVISSIVEGSDAEVPAVELDLLTYASPDSVYREAFAKECADAFDRLCDETNDAACALWEEANGESDEDEAGGAK